MPEFVKVAKLHDMPPKKGLAVKVDGQCLVIYQVGGDFYALEDSCSHVGAPLSQGFLTEDGCAVCPLHAAMFDIKTGAALTAPARDPVKTYKVRVCGDDIEVEA